MDERVLEKLELNKILCAAAEYAVLAPSKEALRAEQPRTALPEAEQLLALTAEADAALFDHGAGRIEAFPEVGEELGRARKGAALSCGELLSVAALLRSARVAQASLHALPEGNFPC